MTLSCAWPRILSAPAGSIARVQVRDPKIAACRRLPHACGALLPSRLYAEYSNINKCQKRVTSPRLLGIEGQYSLYTGTKSIHSYVRRPRVSSNRNLSVSKSLWQLEQSIAGLQLRGRRCFLTSTLGAFLTPPAVFIGLMTVLWFYKCCMMVLFQNKIIYMPSVPPFSRREEISTYERETRPVAWSQETIKSLDGTSLALCVGTLQPSSTAHFSLPPSENVRHIYIIYFHGNASSLPPRLSMLTGALKAICEEAAPVTATIIALSYRGYWKSSGRASQPGIEQDAAATINWVQQVRARTNVSSKLVIWGQSIGAGVATRAVANYLGQNQQNSQKIDGIVLETPFTSIKSMLQELYPQKWLPYRYLWPFLRSWWDTTAALHEIKDRNGPRDLLVLTAGKDEVVPTNHGKQLFKLSSELGFNVHYQTIPGAYHHEVMVRSEGKFALAKFLARLHNREQNKDKKT